jgi:DNA-binding PadR family transcriptional regulator
MARLDNTTIVILGLLHFRDMHGYEVKRTIEREMGGSWSINYGSIYPCLRKLEVEGYVQGHKEEVSKKPPRIAYTITGKGREEFQRLMDQKLKGEVVYKDELNVLLVFFDFLDKEMVKKYLLKRKAQTEELLEKTIAAEKETRGKIGKYFYGLFRRGVFLCKAELEWLKELEERKE